MERDPATVIKPATVRYCHKCGSPFHFQLHRNRFVKIFLFFLPLRVYFCAKCQKARYIMVKKKKPDAGSSKTNDVLKTGNVVS